MERRLDINYVKSLLTAKGWQQSDLAQAVGVSDAAVSQWLNAEHVPRAGMLVKVAVKLGGDVEKLLVQDSPQPLDHPLVAFRRKGQQVTKDFDEERALDQGFALERLAPLLGDSAFKPREFNNPTTQYEHVEELAELVRKELCTADQACVKWEQLISWFSAQGAVLVPVFWGERENHGNALHIYLPTSGHTFVYINLDSEELDFKFWLAHEMAHMLTPSLVGKEEGEDFADAFSGSLLFPQRQAAAAYRECLSATKPYQVIDTLVKYASSSGVSLNTVYMQCKRLAEAKGAAALMIDSTKLHQRRRILDQKVGRIRRHFFDDAPSATTYVQVCEKEFKTPFFKVLRSYLAQSSEGAAYIRRVLHCSMKDAVALHDGLRGAHLERSAD